MSLTWTKIIWWNSFSSCLIRCSVSTDKVTTCFWQQVLSIEKCTFVSDVIYALVASVIAQKGWSELLFLLEDKITFIIQMVHKSQWDLIEGDKTGKSAIIWRRNILPRKSYYKLYCSASGGVGGGNIPPEVCITNLKPDITKGRK